MLLGVRSTLHGFMPVAQQMLCHGVPQTAAQHLLLEGWSFRFQFSTCACIVGCEYNAEACLADTLQYDACRLELKMSEGLEVSHQRGRWQHSALDQSDVTGICLIVMCLA